MTSNAVDASKFPTDSQRSSSTRAASGMSSTPNSPQPLSAEKIDALKADLATDSLKKQLGAIRQLGATGDTGVAALVAFIQQAQSQELNQTSGESISAEPFTAAHGSAYQQLYKADSAIAQSFITEQPEGLLRPKSDRGIDYSKLQALLVQQDYQAADKLTTQKLCEIAGENATKRKWVYFTEVKQFPQADLLSIDALWRIYSEDRFGWSKQHELWTRLGKDWARLWDQLLWQNTDGTWTRYPGEFTWDLSAPIGHLPLSNQLRGVRVMDALLSHPAWDQST